MTRKTRPALAHIGVVYTGIVRNGVVELEAHSEHIPDGTEVEVSLSDYVESFVEKKKA